MDEPLLRRFDADDQVKRDGRSAVLRREYLRRRRARRITDAYRNGCRDGRGLGDEFVGWEGEGSWPAK